MSDQSSNQKKNPELPDQIGAEFVDFLKDGKSKKALQTFIMDSFSKFENEKLMQMMAQLEEQKAKQQGRSTDPAEDYVPSNISAIASDHLNMHDAERAFVRGIKKTKESLIRTLEDRVEEINRLLSGLGGFNAQLKSCFARSTVVFLEQEDPRNSYRERLIFSINLPNYELRRAWTNTVPEAKPTKKLYSVTGKKKSDNIEEDPRTPLQATWDDAVNSLAQIVATTGLKPKYCKNDRHYGRFVMKQDLRSSANLPDEYFSFTLDYNTNDKIKDMCGPYNKIVKDYDVKLAKMEKRLSHYTQDSLHPSYLTLKNKYLNLKQERDFFVGTTPDPNQLDEGLLFLIEVSTLKDYMVVKDRMQSIMTKYILHLSKIAMKDAQRDNDLNEELWKLQRAGVEEDENAAAEAKYASSVSPDQLSSVKEYLVDEAALQPVPTKSKKDAA